MIDFEVSDGVAVVTLNRPEVRNAIDAETAQLLAAAVDEVENRTDIVSMVITGAGGVFCSGMDLKAFIGGQRRVSRVVASRELPKSDRKSR